MQTTPTLHALVVFYQGTENEQQQAKRHFISQFQHNTLPMIQELLQIASSTTQNLPVPQHLLLQIRSMAVLLLSEELTKGEPYMLSTLPDQIQSSIQHSLLSSLAIEQSVEISRILILAISKIAPLQLHQEMWDQIIPTILCWSYPILQHQSSTLFSQCLQLQPTNPHIMFHGVQLLVEIATHYFDGIFPHFPIIYQLLNAIYTPSDSNNIPQLSTMEFKVKGIHLIRQLIGQPEVNQETTLTFFWNAIMTTLQSILTSIAQSPTPMSIQATKSILTWLLEIVTEEKEESFFRPHISILRDVMKQIAMYPHFGEDIKELALELLVSLVELRPQFINGVTTAASKLAGKKAQSKSVPNSSQPTPSQLYLETVLEIIFTFMHQIECDQDWVLMCPVDTDNADNGMDSMYNDAEQHHQAGLYAFARVIGCCNKTRITTQVLPKLFSLLQLPSTPFNQLPNAATTPDVNNNIREDQYNANWKQHVMGLQLFAQIASPLIIPDLAQLHMDEIFTLLTSSHPRVQYSSLLTISTLAMEYKSPFVFYIIQQFLSILPNHLQQMHLPHIQQITCTTFHILLSEMRDIPKDTGQTTNLYSKLAISSSFSSSSSNHFDNDVDTDCDSVEELNTQIDQIFTQSTVHQIMEFLTNIFTFYFTNVDHSIKINTIGIQINILSCIAELSFVSPQHYIPWLQPTQQLLTSILTTPIQINSEASTNIFTLQCKAIESFTFIYTQLHSYCTNFLQENNPSTSTSTSISTSTSTASSPISNCDLTQLNPTQFSTHLLTESSQFITNCHAFYQNVVQTYPQYKEHHESILKYLLRGFARLCPILDKNFIPFLPFVMEHLINQLNTSIRTKVRPNGEKTLMMGGFNSSNSTSNDEIALELQAQNDHGDDSSLMTSKRIEQEQLDLFYEDVTVVLSILDHYIKQFDIFTLPWLYDILSIVLYYINYPQNNDIQLLAAAILPNIIKMLTTFLIQSGITSSSHPHSQFNIQNISSYLCYQQDYFQPFFEKQSSLQQQTLLPSPFYSTMITNTSPTCLYTPLSANQLETKPLLQQGANGGDIFDLPSQLGLRFVLPTIPQSSRTIVYIIEYLLYIMKLEMDYDIIITLLSCLACCIDEIDPLYFTNTSFHLCNILFDQLLVLIYTTHDTIRTYTTAMINKIKKKTTLQTTAHTFMGFNALQQQQSQESQLYQNNDDDHDDDDDDDDDEMGSDAEDDDENDDDENNAKQINSPCTSILLSPEYLSSLHPQFGPLLSQSYLECPLDESVLTILTETNNMICEQLCYILTRVMKQCKVDYTPSTINLLSQSQPRGSQLTSLDSIYYFMKQIQFFSSIISLHTPSQHPLALFDTYQRSIQLHQQQTQQTQQTQSQSHPLSTQYTYHTQKLPYLLYHSFFNTYQDALPYLLSFAVNHISTPSMPNDIELKQSIVNFFQHFISSVHTSFLLLQRQLMTYTSTYDLIKAVFTPHFIQLQATAGTLMAISPSIANMKADKDKTFWVKLFHNQNSGVLLEHLGYSAGILIEYISSYKFICQPTLPYQTEQINQQHPYQLPQHHILSYFWNHIATFPYQSPPIIQTVFGTNNTTHSSPIDPSSILTSLLQLSTTQSQYFQQRFKLTFNTLSNYILPNNPVKEILQANEATKLGRLHPQYVVSIEKQDPSCSFTSLLSTQCTPTCSLFLYGYDNLTMCYTRWTLAGIQMHLEQFKITCASQSTPISTLLQAYPSIPPNAELTQLFTHLLYICSFLIPFYRDMNELSVLYQLFSNLFITGYLDAKVDDELLAMMTYPMTSQVQNESWLVQRNQTISSVFHAAPSQFCSTPSLFSILYRYYSPFSKELLQNELAIKQQRNQNNFMDITIFYPLLLAFAKGFAIVDLIPTCRISIELVINTVICAHLGLSFGDFVNEIKLHSQTPTPYWQNIISKHITASLDLKTIFGSNTLAFSQDKTVITSQTTITFVEVVTTAVLKHLFDIDH